MNIADFWVAFLGGLASGIALTILTAFMRKLLRKPAEGERKPRWKTRELRPLILMGAGFILILLAVFSYKSIGIMSGSLIGIAIVLIGTGAGAFIS